MSSDLARSFRSTAAVLGGCLIIALCLFVSGREIFSVGRALRHRPAGSEPVPALGQADLVYFSEPTCPACQEAAPGLLALERRFTRYHFAHVNTATPAGIALQEEYNRAYHVPQADQGRIPIAFVGGRYFLGTDQIGQALPAYLAAGPLIRHAWLPRPARNSGAILEQRSAPWASPHAR